MLSMHRLVLLCSLVVVVDAVEFHVDPAGDDAGDGSRDKPWKTLARVNAWAEEPGFAPGDSILLASGATFEGHLFISTPTRTTAELPLTIAASGEAPATIEAGKEHGIEIVDLGGVKLKNLVIRGVPGDRNNGVFFMANGTQGERLAPIRIERVVASGFGRCGILIGSWGRTYAGFDGIHMSAVVANHNGESGIATFDHGHAEDLGKYAHKNLTMVGCEAGFNKSISGKNATGNGIVISGVDGGVVAGCRAHHNQNSTAGGNVGIWTYSTRKVIISYSISHNNMSAGKDGGGFDIDGGSQECLVENSYSFGNSGMGFMHCDFPGSRPTTRNAIRYCISENDGQKPGVDGIFAFVSWGEGITESVIEHCTGSGNEKTGGSLVGLEVHILKGYGKSPRVDRCEFRNNIVVVRGGDDLLARNPQQDGTVIFQGNLYWAAGQATPKWQIPYEVPIPIAQVSATTESAALQAEEVHPPTNIVRSVQQWRMHGGDSQKHPESINFGDPCFVGEGAMGEVTDWQRLPAAALAAYSLRPESPAINLAEKGFEILGLFEPPADFADQPLWAEAKQQGLRPPVKQVDHHPESGLAEQASKPDLPVINHDEEGFGLVGLIEIPEDWESNYLLLKVRLKEVKSPVERDFHNTTSGALKAP